MKDECVLGLDPAECPHRAACRYWDLTLRRCAYRETREAERKKRHDDRFRDDGVEERVRIT